MKVLTPAPHTCPLSFALATCVVGVPLLTPITLADGIASVTSAFLHGFHTFMVLVAEQNAVLQNTPLCVLTIKAYYDFIGFGPVHFVQKSSYFGQF